MNKYKIEGNIDFFGELYKSLDDENKSNDDDNLCLISSEPLVDKFVTLICGHKFNYIPLYNDILNHKKKFNSLESSGQLKMNEIRCPYCRKKQEYTLTYYEELGLKQVPGVNMKSESNGYSSFAKNVCEYKTPNPDFDPNCTNPQEFGYTSNCKFFECFLTYACQIENNYNDSKYYCWKHKKVMLKQYKKADLDKLKEEKQKAKEEKQKAKEEKQKAKEEKQKAKEEKEKLKEELKLMVMEEKLKINKSKNVVTNANSSKSKSKNNKPVIENIVEEENVVIGVLEVATVCSEILKTGLNKGNQCGISVFKDCLCKRHYNLKNK